MLLLTRRVEGSVAHGEDAVEPVVVVRAVPSPAATAAASAAALRAWVAEQASLAATPDEPCTVEIDADAETCRYAADLLAASGVTAYSVGQRGASRGHGLSATVPCSRGDVLADLLDSAGTAEEVRITGRGRWRATCVVYHPQLPEAMLRMAPSDPAGAALGTVSGAPGAASRRRRRRALSRPFLVVAGLAAGTACAGILALGTGHDRPAREAGTPPVVADLGPAPTEPPARRVPAAAYDSARGQLVVFGGVGMANGLLSDTWTFDGRRWSRHDAGPQPPARIGASLVYDQQARQVLLVGGLRFTLVSLGDDMWAWDGASWTQLHPVGAAPQPILPGVAAWDSALQRVVFVGVCRRLGGPADVQTWAFDGQRWLSLRPSHEPPLRHGALLADAPGLASLVLVEPDGAPGDSGQTWTFDGADWRSAPAPGPARVTDDESIVADPRSGLVVLTGPRGDSAAWDGTRWRDAEARAAQTEAIPFSDGNRVLLVGGDAGQLRTWAWDGQGWSQASSPVAGVSSRDVDEERS